MSNDHHREKAYYLAHQQTLQELYGGRTVVIKDECVVGAYDDAAWARPQTSNRYGGGAFFVQKVAALVRHLPATAEQAMQRRPMP